MLTTGEQGFMLAFVVSFLRRGFGAWRGFLFLAPSGEPLFLVAVMGAGLFFVLLTLVAVKEQNLLSVGTAHAVSVRGCRVVVKRTTMSKRGILLSYV